MGLMDGSAAVRHDANHEDHRVDALLGELCRPYPAPMSVRALVIVAHPDDETIGAATRLARLSQPTIVTVTTGSPTDPTLRTRALSQDHYAELRERELGAALALAGIGRDQLVGLRRIDQEASTNMASLAREISALFRRVRPDVVLTHPYEGGHPDHDATSFAVHAAARSCADLNPAPVVIEMAFYNAFGVYRFLPNQSSSSRECVVRLCPAEVELKRQMFACHASQADILAPFPIDVERFRLAPKYDFTRPPHDGPTHYETMNWTSVETWLNQARTALVELTARDASP